MLKTIFLFIVIVHGLIHLMGFATAFNLAEMHAGSHGQIMFICAIPGSWKVICWMLGVHLSVFRKKNSAFKIDHICYSLFKNNKKSA